jgi:MFS family permease
VTSRAGEFRAREFGGQAALGTLAQLTQGIIGLALLLVGHETHLGVTAAALAVSAFAVGMAAGRPVQGRALDRAAAAPVLIGCGLVHGAGYVVIAVAAHRHWPAPFALAALVAGLTLPPIATQMRAAWPHGRAVEAVPRVFATITAVQTISVLLAPVLFTVVNAISSPTAAMLTVAGVSVVCTVAFGVVCADVPSRADHGSRVRLRTYAALLAGTLLVGAVSGTLEVAAPAIAIGAGHPGAAGPLVTIATVGTLVGATIAMRRPVPLRIALLVQVIGAVLLVVPASLVLTGVALLVLGAGVTPALAALSTAISLRAGGTAESFGWQSTGLGLGVTAGSAAAGWLAGLSAHWSALPSLVAAGLALISSVRVGAGVGAVRNAQRGARGEHRGDGARGEQRAVGPEGRQCDAGDNDRARGEQAAADRAGEAAAQRTGERVESVGRRDLRRRRVAVDEGRHGGVPDAGRGTDDRRPDHDLPQRAGEHDA